MKINKFRFIFILLLSSNILVIAVGIFVNLEKPNANAIVELRDVPNKENLKEIYVEVNILNAKNSSRDIFIPQLSAIDKLDKIRSEKVSTSEVNNAGSAYAQTISSFIFDMDNLTFEQIKDIYSNDIIIAKVLTKKGKELAFTFNLGESLIDKTSK